MTKETRLHLRLTEEEKNLWQESAESEGVALSQFIRAKVNAAVAESHHPNQESMTVKELMLSRFRDSVYLTALVRDPEETERAVNIYEQPPQLPLLDYHDGRTEKEKMADELHGFLEGIIIRHFLRQYNWEEMKVLFDLLERMDALGIKLCSGLHVPLDLLKLRWNDMHPEKRII